MSIFSSFESLFLFLVVCKSEIVEQNRGKRLFLVSPDPGNSDSNGLSNKASFCKKKRNLIIRFSILLNFDHQNLASVCNDTVKTPIKRPFGRNVS